MMGYQYTVVIEYYKYKIEFSMKNGITVMPKG